MRGNPFKVVSAGDLSGAKATDICTTPGSVCEIKYEFSFTAPAGKVIIVKGKRIEKLFKALRRTLKEYMKEAEKDGSIDR
jgi:hypothetical protein